MLSFDKKTILFKNKQTKIPLFCLKKRIQFGEWRRKVEVLKVPGLLSTTPGVCWKTPAGRLNWQQVPMWCSHPEAWQSLAKPWSRDCDHLSPSGFWGFQKGFAWLFMNKFSWLIWGLLCSSLRVTETQASGDINLLRQEEGTSKANSRENNF